MALAAPLLSSLLSVTGFQAIGYINIAIGYSLQALAIRESVLNSYSAEHVPQIARAPGAFHAFDRGEMSQAWAE